MAELKSMIEGSILSPREIWALNNGYEIDVALETDRCTCFIKDANGNDIAEIVSKLLEAKNIKHHFTGSIDCYCIELSKNYKESFIELVEKSF